MKIEKLNKCQVRKVATLHKSYIHSSFLSSLGNSFLELLYGSMINSDSAFCLVAVENEKPIGFVAGVTKLNSFHKEFINKKFLLAGCIIAVKVIRPSLFKKTLETLTYPKKRDINLPEAELISIVVEEKFQEQGVAKLLFQALVEEFKKKGIEEFKIVVGSQLGKAKLFYEKMGGIFLKQIEVHKGEKSEVYIWKINTA